MNNATKAIQDHAGDRRIIFRYCTLLKLRRDSSLAGLR
jgi:hypothetical protein